MDMSKLPKWVQAEIKRLKADIEYYKQKAYQASGKEETNVFILEGTDVIPLPKDSRIMFKVNSDDRIYEQIEVHIVGEETIEVRSAKCLKIIPRVSNSIYVERQSEY